MERLQPSGAFLKRGMSLMLLLALLVAGGWLGAAQAQETVGQALVWQVGGQPGDPVGLGTLFWHTVGEEPLNLSDVPDEGAGTRVFSCGADAVSRDGSYMIAYIGGQNGGLYHVPLAEDTGIERLADAHALACNGRGLAGFSPDGTKWAYLAFAPDVIRSVFPGGVLRVIDPLDGSELASFEDVVAFDLRDDGAYYAQFFTNSQGMADEMAVSWWDGTRASELEVFTPAEGCDWRSAALDSSSDGLTVVLSLGEHCPGGSQWRVFSFTRDGQIREHVYMPSGGAYFPSSTINQVVFLPDDTHVLATFPQGRASNIANLVLITLEMNTVTLVTPEVTIDTFPDGHARHIQFSPDGQYLAYVSSTANDEHMLHRLTLDGGYQPVNISAGSRGDAISTFFFLPDGGLVYVAGGTAGGDNSLFLLAAGETEPRRITRGNFLGDAGIAVGDGVLVLEYVEPDDDNPDPAANLVQVALDGGSKTVIVDGREATAWAYPLAWR